jgi:hypothetical protein
MMIPLGHVPEHNLELSVSATVLPFATLDACRQARARRNFSRWNRMVRTRTFGTTDEQMRERFAQQHEKMRARRAIAH